MIDAIVFTQSELDYAVESGAKRIVLCDNNFILPSVEDITYTSIGRVTVHNGDTPAVKAVSAARAPRVSSYSSSYKPASYSSSYRFSGSYRFGSFNTSYITSFLTSYRYSYEYKTAGSGSYLTSYRLSGSYMKSSALLSFIHLFKRRLYDRVLKEISVNGYGIHLI